MVLKAFLLTYCFSVDLDYNQTIRETSHYDAGTTSSATVAYWFSYSREICTLALANRYENYGPMGGVNSIIEIDEMKMGRRKYQVSHGVFQKYIFARASGGRELDIGHD